MARAGVRPDISDRVLGHAIAGVAGTYDRHTFDPKKADALQPRRSGAHDPESARRQRGAAAALIGLSVVSAAKESLLPRQRTPLPQGFGGQERQGPSGLPRQRGVREIYLGCRACLNSKPIPRLGGTAICFQTSFFCGVERRVVASPRRTLAESPLAASVGACWQAKKAAKMGTTSWRPVWGGTAHTYAPHKRIRWVDPICLRIAQVDRDQMRLLPEFEPERHRPMGAVKLARPLAS